MIVCGMNAVFGRSGAMIGGSALVRGDVTHFAVAELLVQCGGLVVSVGDALLGLSGKRGSAYRRTP
jgi:hypothetical protein